MNTKLRITSLVVVCVCVLAYAEGPAGGETADIQTDAIFDEILQSLPTEAKEQVDSAKRTSAATESAPVSSQSQEMSAERLRQREQALEELPEELRNQVEKAIGQIESAAEQRQMEFKERKSERTGQK